MPAVIWHGKVSRGYFGLATLKPGENDIDAKVWATIVEIDKGQVQRTGAGFLSGDLSSGLLEVGGAPDVPASLGSLALADAKDAIAQCGKFELLLELYGSEMERKKPRSTLLSAMLTKAKKLAKAAPEDKLVGFQDLALQASIEELAAFVGELLPAGDDVPSVPIVLERKAVDEKLLDALKESAGISTDNGNEGALE